MKSMFLVCILGGFLFINCVEQNPTSKFDQLNLEETTIEAIQTGYANGDFTVKDIVEAYLGRIQDIDVNGPGLNSIIQVNPDAIAIAEALDAELASGNSRGPMHGIPVILKDNIDTHDQMNTTGGATALANSKPLQDSFIVKKLRENGAVIIAKANLSEWANFHSSFSSSGWSAVGGQTHNPYDLSRNPCGSSAGSGASVSANLGMVAIGTETNGSIVCPSNNNGVVGIKPTVGLLSRSGIIPISHTQDTPGPMTRTLRDGAIALGAMVGVDEADEKSVASEGRFETDYTQFLNADGLDDKRIAIFTQPLGQHFRVDSVFNDAVEYLKSQGATVIEIDRISTENIGGDSFQVLLYEFKDGLNKYFASLGPNAPVKNVGELWEQTMNDPTEMRYFDHDLIKQAQALGDLNSKEYTDALARLVKYSRAEGMDRVMDEHNLDAIIAPTGGIAWKTDLTNGDRFGVFSSSPAAWAGYPSITVPMGTLDGMPLGISFFGRAWSEPVLIEIAYSYEQGTRKRVAPKFLNPKN